jgi:putative oxidoreductase
VTEVVWLGELPELAPSVSAGLLLLRVFVGVTFSLHGFQKLFGWFGGGGLGGTAGWFRSLGLGDGRVAAVLAGVGEIAGGLGLALGLLTPLAATAMIGTMTVAAYVNASENGFWSVSKGWELNGYLIVVAWAVATTGPGRHSLDAVLGVPVPTGVVPGLAALALGVGAGTLRWTTRSRSGR